MATWPCCQLPAQGGHFDSDAGAQAHACRTHARQRENRDPSVPSLPGVQEATSEIFTPLAIDFVESASASQYQDTFSAAISAGGPSLEAAIESWFDQFATFGD